MIQKKLILLLLKYVKIVQDDSKLFYSEMKTLFNYIDIPQPLN